MAIYFDAAQNEYTSDGKRPHGHLNQRTLQAIISDIIAKTPLTEAEQMLILNQGKASPATLPTGVPDAKKIAQRMKAHKFLSHYNYAICHKIPYASFEKALIELFNHGAANAKAWTSLSLLLQGLHGIGYSSLASQQISDLQNGLSTGNTATVEYTANSMLSEFDEADDNLYVGFAQTNSSIGQLIDLHYNILSTGNHAIVSTPRGANLATLLQALENALGMAATGPREVVDKKGLKWQETSSVDGIGWVVIV